MSVEGNVLEIIRKKPEVKVILQRALEFEGSMDADDLGFEWFQVGGAPTLLNRLCVEPQRILKITLKTGSSTHYRLLDVEATRKALEFLREELKIEAEKPFAIPYDLFDDIVDFEDIKELFIKGLEVGKVHFLLVGPPASAKTLFLLCLERLPKSRYVLGSRMSKAGLTEYLFTHQPKVLLLDEIDKLSGPDYGVLLSLCETGRVCLPPDQVLLTNPRLKRISDITVGDEVIGASGCYQQVVGVATREYDGYLVEIKPRYLPPTRLTPEHPIFIMKKICCSYDPHRICRPNCSHNWERYCSHPYLDYKAQQVPASTLERGDFVFYPKNDEEETFAWDLRVGKNMITTDNGVYLKYDKQKRLFPHKLESCDDLAVFLGWYLAEGSVHDGQISFGLNAETEGQLAEELKATIERLFPVRVNVINCPHWTIQVRFRSKLIADILTKDFGKGASNKRVPIYVLRAPKRFVERLLVSYFKGDGTVKKQGTKQMSTVSTTLAYQLVALLAKVGIIASLRVGTKNTGSRGRKPKRLNIVCAHGVVADSLFGGAPPRAKYRYQQYWESEGGYWIPVDNVKFIKYKGSVHNIKTPDSTYLTSFLIHNCEMVYGKTREVALDTVVFGCANRLKGIPEEVLSRFQILKFEPYTRERFINIVENVLKRRGMEEDLALYVAKAVWDELESKDPRAAVRIARLAKTRAEVDRLVGIIKKYR